MENNTKQITKAVILAAGKGTRFMPATLCVAKEIFPILEKPALFYHLKECVQSGITDVLIVISKSKKDMLKFIYPDVKQLNALIASGKKDFVEEYIQVLSQLNIKVKFCNKALGSAYAMLPAKKWSNGEPYILIFGDDIMVGNTKTCISQIADVYYKTGKPVINFVQFKAEEMYKYGTAEISGQDGRILHLKSLVEKPAPGTEPSTYGIASKYVITPNVYDEIAKLQPKNGEYCLTDAWNSMASRGEVVGWVLDGTYYDCGSKLGLTKCYVDFALKDESISNEFSQWLSQKTKGDSGKVQQEAKKSAAKKSGKATAKPAAKKTTNKTSSKTVTKAKAAK